jgi:hypothetical protein
MTREENARRAIAAHGLDPEALARRLNDGANFVAVLLAREGLDPFAALEAGLTKASAALDAVRLERDAREIALAGQIA